ncbi:hypothetical protein RI367_003000 [Sorochytrium milnesiophthora]
MDSPLAQLQTASTALVDELESLVAVRRAGALPSPKAAAAADRQRVLNLLVEQQTLQRTIYQNMMEARAASSQAREEAAKSRLSKLNRDWYKDHLQSDIEINNGFSNSFEFDSLVSEEEVLAAEPVVEGAAPLAAHELALKRIEHEYLARQNLRQVLTKREGKLKSVRSEVKLASKNLKKIDGDILEWINGAQSLMQRYSIQLEDGAVAAFAQRNQPSGETAPLEDTEATQPPVDTATDADPDQASEGDREDDTVSGLESEAVEDDATAAKMEVDASAD